MSTEVVPGFRVERDSMGSLQVPETALWGAQTQRAVQNFPISGQPMPRAFLRALGLIKAAAASVNARLGHLDAALGAAIREAALSVASGAHDSQFPVDVFQTGSGTSSNMNANEVIATLASRQLGAAIHPNDHVNAGQSSNDVIPSAIQLAGVLVAEQQLRPALQQLIAVIDARALPLDQVAKTGRTHLMDAMPLTMGQELRCWSAQLQSADARIADTLQRVRHLPLGGTAIGTGINADPRFGELVCAELTALGGVPVLAASNRFEGIAAKDECVELSGQLKTLACALMKIANDLRWMNSGPLAGLGEIELPALQPGSSIMPGKVNPVIPEAVCMVCAQVIGNDAAITVAGQSGNFQLNVMLPLIARNLLESQQLLANVMVLLATRCIAGFKLRQERINEVLQRNPILVTALNGVIGYEVGAATAKRAYAEGRSILEVARETTGLSEQQLRVLLDPLALTAGGLVAGGRSSTS